MFDLKVMIHDTYPLTITSLHFGNMISTCNHIPTHPNTCLVPTLHHQSILTRSLAQGKAKRRAWEKLVTDKVSPQDAQKKYVTLVADLKKKHGFTG